MECIMIRKPSFLLSLAIATCAVGTASAVQADQSWSYVSNDVVVDLLASKDAIDAGDITFSAPCDTITKTCEDPDTNANSADDCGTADVSDPGTYVDGNLSFAIATDDGWQFVEWHVDVENESTSFPTTRKGNPQVGQFEYSFEADSILDYGDSSGTIENGAFPGDGDLDVAVHSIVYMPLACDEAMAAGAAECDGDAETTDDVCYEDQDGGYHTTALEACGYNFDANGESAWGDGTRFTSSKRSWATFVDDLDEGQFCTWTCSGDTCPL
jgi:hypothetical protein